MQGKPSQTPSGQPVAQQVSAAAGAAKEFFACDAFDVEPEFQTTYASVQLFDKTDAYGNVIRYARYFSTVKGKGSISRVPTVMPQAQFMVSFLNSQITLLQRKEATAKAKIKRYEDAIKPLRKYIADKDRDLTQAELAQLSGEESVAIMEEGRKRAVHETRIYAEGSRMDLALQQRIADEKARIPRTGSESDIYTGNFNHIDDAPGTAPKFYRDVRVLIDEYVGKIETITDGELKPIQGRLACDASQRAQWEQQWLQTYTYLKQTGQIP